MPKLYELTDEYAGLVSMLDDCETEEEAAEIADRINAVTDDISAKAEAYARIRLNLQSEAAVLKAQAASFKAEADRLAAKAKARENNVKRLQDYLLYAMEVAGLEKLRTPLGMFYPQTTTSVEVTDAWAVPARFVTMQDPKVDKDAIKRAHKETGEIFEGVEIKHNTGLRFR